uniref:Uncharacterized protein n=1 Tax=Arundo donax TaxID=35708 RepID=A0A0A8YHL5_ARUDO
MIYIINGWFCETSIMNYEFCFFLSSLVM